MSFLRARSAIRTLRARAATVLGFAAATHLTLDLVYRPWAVQRAFPDFGLAGSFTQVTSVIGISAIMVLVESDWFWQDKWNRVLLACIPIIAMLTYEVLQLWLPWATFDTRDILWTFVGGALAGAINGSAYDSVKR